ncbi:MAG: acyl-CoA dehydrogenase family protein [Acidobacteria bacterium]|nr:acyl-CoA dehydrogenase family protein [Acidobacteriota bacterium]
MDLQLTHQHEADRAEFRDFVDREIVPHADRFDLEERIPRDTIDHVAARGYFGVSIPREYGGRGSDMITYGLLHEEIGRGCSSLRSIITVQGMVAHAIGRWGVPAQHDAWLPPMAAGRRLVAFALSEPEAGSDPQAIACAATRRRGEYVLNGRKKWITGGQIADAFLVIARAEGKPGAWLVDRDAPGLTISPIRGLLGVRASMLSELTFSDCRVPGERLVGRLGFGLSHVAFSSLDHGRYCVAWGAVGIGQAALRASLDYAGTRRQHGVYLKDHQLIRRMLSDGLTNLAAARLLCYQAACRRDAGDPRAVIDTFMAKYFASTMARRAADDCVQIHGASGCSGDYPAQRYLRDAKIMEIIEGTTQLQQLTIAQGPYEDVYEKVH